MTILTDRITSPYTIRLVAMAAHPDKGSTVIDAVLNNDGTPLGNRLRSLIAERLGEDWTVLDWYPAEGEF